jgi:hypothetical protein
MKTITTTLYEYDELSNEAKEKAIEEMYNINVDYDWWDYSYADAENIGLKITGFDIDRGSYCSGDFIESAEETAEKIIANHGETCETYRTAKDYLAERSALVVKYSDGINTNVVTEENEYDFDCECDDIDAEFLRSLLEDYRIILQHEYEYLTSEEAIIETIQANEYHFSENGSFGKKAYA